MADTLSFPCVEPTDDVCTFRILPHRPHNRPHHLSRTAPVSAASTKSSKSKSKSKHPIRPGSYQSLGLNPNLCASLRAAGYNFPTPIQRKSIPPILSGRDVIAMARTGSGKTAAFLAPLLHLLQTDIQPTSASARHNGPRALVISPTRELALQTLNFANKYSKGAPVRTALIVGGTPLHAQFEALAVCPPLLIATPGRLLHLLAEMAAKRALTLATAQMLVLDEADRLFEGTLAVETAALLAQLRHLTPHHLTSRQTVLVSATMPRALAEFSRTNLRPNLAVLRLDVEKSLPPTLATAFLTSRGDLEKDAALLCLLRTIREQNKSVVVFAATHRRVEYITALLQRTMSLKVLAIHGNLDNSARLDAVSQFRKQTVQVLVVTDVAARGIDLPLLDVVINYDMPGTPKLFVHRVGRVARAGRFGMAFLLVTPDELGFMLDVYLFIGRPVKLADSNIPQHDAFASQAFALDSSFVVGGLPKTMVDEEVELIRNNVLHIELDKLHHSAKNAQKLYMKTRGCASGESMRRAKSIFATDEGGRKTVGVHPWFATLESGVEKTATLEAARLSTWKPRECVVTAPASLTKRKRPVPEQADDDFDKSARNGQPGVEEEVEDQSVAESLRKIGEHSAMPRKKRKMSARQLAMEHERQQFFMPAQLDSSLAQSEKALRASSGGKMGDDMRAYREIYDAAVDVNGDSNGDLLRAKHTGNNTAKYWDRVSKKFVKGGVTDATSKRNLHVASREARARAKAGESYSKDGEMFKKWLSKNRKTVQQLAGQADEQTKSNLPLFRDHVGLGGNDFRKGAYGRRARVAAAGRNKALAEGGSEGSRGRGAPKNELKSKDEIMKARKYKAKAELRRVARESKKKGPSNKKQQQVRRVPQKGQSKTRMIVRRK